MPNKYKSNKLAGQTRRGDLHLLGEMYAQYNNIMCAFLQYHIPCAYALINIVH